MSAPKVQLESYSAPTSPNSAIEPWTMESWQKRPIAQQPEYKDKAQLQSCLDKIRSLPPLVHPNEINSLRKQLADACRGERFVLQGGDCAERFQDCRKDSIEAKLKILLQMSLVLVWGARIPTIRIGRVAGQYGKPRSAPTEIVNGKELMCFKGDNVNGFDATAEAREHDPARLVEGHFHSACTLNYIRALIKGGYADLHHARAWDLGYVAEAKRREQYQEITSRILDSLDFMRTVGVGEDDAAVGQVDFFTSHEGLILAYEAAVTREVIHETRKGRRHLRPDPLLPAAKSLAPTSPSTEGPSPLASPDASAGRIIESHPPSPVQGDASLPPSRSANLLPAPTDLSGVNQVAAAAPAAAESLVRYYNTGAHFLWIGDRTRQLDGAHIEYFRGVVNPIGCKVGPSMKPQELVELIKTVDPNNEPGRLSLITRFGAENVRTHLPPLLKAVQEAGLQVLWICDPMHGNTVKTKSSIKTRRFDAIMEEITTTFKIHQEHGSHLGGVHFELTGEDVTECVGGPQDLEEDDLHLNYTTYCDPRLNYAQSMEVSFKLAQLLRSSRR